MKNQPKYETCITGLLAEIRKVLDLKRNNYMTYGDDMLLLMEIIANSAGYTSCRDISTWYELLSKEKALGRLYKMFDCDPAKMCKDGLWQTPSHSTFNAYEKRLEHGIMEKLINGKYLRDKIKKIYRRLMAKQRISSVPNQKNRIIIHISVDGKDIRNTADKDHSTNVISMQIMMNGELVKTIIVENESAWIKTDLIPTLEELRKDIPGARLFFTGDMIYRRPNLLEYLIKHDDYYLFRVKCTTTNNKLYHELVGEFPCAKRDDKTITTTTVKKQGGSITTDVVECFPITHKYADNVIFIDRSESPINTPIRKRGKAKKTDNNKAHKKMNCEKIMLMGRWGKPITKKDLEIILEYKRLHWKVETYHAYRDQIYNEDRYHKSRILAAIGARILDLALILTEKAMGFCDKLRYPAKKREPMLMDFMARRSLLSL